MLKKILSIIFIFLSVPLLSQETCFALEKDSSSSKSPPLDVSSELYLFLSNNILNEEAIESEIKKFCQELKNIPVKNEKRFLRRVFYKTHRRFLQHYAQYSAFQDIFSKGNYDCVSGSALYALILKELSIDFTIRETPFHVYLLVYLKNGKVVLIESTNAMTGFITDPVTILELGETFSQLHLEKFGKNHIPFNYQITLKQLAGLHYYNLGIDAFNQEKFDMSYQFLQKALQFYDSERIVALTKLNELYLKNLATNY